MTGRPRSINREQVSALVAEGLDDRTIAKRLNCTEQSANRIRNELARNGLAKPSAPAEQDAAFSARLSAAKGKTKPNAQRDSSSKVSRKASDSEPAA